MSSGTRHRLHALGLRVDCSFVLGILRACSAFVCCMWEEALLHAWAQQFPIREEADTVLSGSSNSFSPASEKDFPLWDRAGRDVTVELH